MTSQHLGKVAEEKALNYLRQQGLQLVIQNYNCPLGEIDLIMRDRSYLVFIEVRSRTNLSFGSGMVSITDAKKKKIMRAAWHYLMTYQLVDKMPLRFDVVSIDGKSGVISWISDAFGEDY
jgi:putative endonuclease